MLDQSRGCPSCYSMESSLCDEVDGQMERGERCRFIVERIDEAVDNDSSGTRYEKF